MKNLTKHSKVVVANKNETLRCTIPKEIAELLDITIGQEIEWTLDVNTEKITLKVLR